MILSLNKIFDIFLKYFIYPLVLLIIVLEFLFQIIFFFDIKSLKKTILFFNPYCDQAYWNIQGNSSYDKKIYSYHPILTLVKKSNESLYEQNIINDKKVVFYGSSFIDHEYFLPFYEEEANFAVKSYGLDQIYKSYMITKDKFINSNVIIGFLLEDLDRAIFNQRNFPKLKFVKDNNIYELNNVPVSFRDNIKNSNHVYTYNFVKNIFFLFLNEFNYKNSECFIDDKKDIFQFFIDNIISNSKNLNQNLIFITFNFKNDVINPNWRYSFIKDHFNSKNLNYIDMTEVIKNDQKKSNFDISNYYNTQDFHLSEYGFNLVRKEIDLFIERYK